MKRNTLKKLLIAGSVLSLLMIFLMLYTCMRPFEASRHEQVVQQERPRIMESYNSFISNWNQFAEAYSFHYRLLGNNASSPASVLNTLQQWCTAFCQPPSEQYKAELARMANELPASTFQAYENFRRKHYREQKLILSGNMSEQELAHALNAYAGTSKNGEIPNYLTPDTVKTILYMNNLCIFFNGEKDLLHEQGIDTNIYRCSDLTTHGAYPYLDSMIK